MFCKNSVLLRPYCCGRQRFCSAATTAHSLKVWWIAQGRVWCLLRSKNVMCWRWLHVVGRQWQQLHQAAHQFAAAWGALSLLCLCCSFSGAGRHIDSLLAEHAAGMLMDVSVCCQRRPSSNWPYQQHARSMLGACTHSSISCPKVACVLAGMWPRIALQHKW